MKAFKVATGEIFSGKFKPKLDRN